MMVGKVKRLANPKAKKNKARRRMTPKQIMHFGTKRQRAALKARRKSKANPKKRTTAKTRTITKVVYRTKKAKRRSNPLQMVTLGLVNPKKRRSTKVTKTKKHNTKKRATSKKRNTKIIVMGRKNAHRHSKNRRHSRNPSIAGVSGGKNLLELVGGGVAGVMLGNAAPGFLPATFTSNPLFTAAAIAAIGWGAGMLVSKVNRNIGDGVMFGAWMQAASTAINSFVPGLGLSGFMPAEFAVPDNPVWNGQQKLLAARAAAAAAASAPATKPSMNGVMSAYGGAY